eukprot:GHVH01007038.1.p1 GENE.GHVH01007038.1~~GHVH01007038.1.p1  ORF type:complete len:332 (-),score=60.05 GHVH01007038.1:183-1178(-)
MILQMTMNTLLHHLFNSTCFSLFLFDHNVLSEAVGGRAGTQGPPPIRLGRSLIEFDGLLAGPLVAGRTGDAKVLVTGDIAETAYINLWINFNNDDQFDDQSELLVRDQFVMTITPVEENTESDPLGIYATLEKVELSIPNNVQAGVYDLRVELNSLPEGAGDVIDFGQMRIAIMTEAVVEWIQVNEPNFDVKELINKLPESSLMDRMTYGLSSALGTLFTATPSSSSADDASVVATGDEPISHEAQEAHIGQLEVPTYVAFIFFSFVAVMLILAMFKIYGWLFKNRKKSSDDNAYQEALGETPVDENTAFGVSSKIETSISSSSSSSSTFN